MTEMERAQFNKLKGMINELPPEGAWNYLRSVWGWGPPPNWIKQPKPSADGPHEDTPRTNAEAEHTRGDYYHDDYIRISFVERLERELNSALKLIKAQTEYIEFLGKAEGMTIGYLHAHNWHYPDDVIEEGVRLREQIREATA